jgi:hypothetical protein
MEKPMSQRRLACDKRFGALGQDVQNGVECFVVRNAQIGKPIFNFIVLTTQLLDWVRKFETGRFSGEKWWSGGIGCPPINP